VIDGEPLEYTGTATQLLLGFFFALAFFLPIYVGAVRAVDAGRATIVLVGLRRRWRSLVWFMMGYAIYRARDFRLSRTLWRGVRFDLEGQRATPMRLRRFLAGRC
jgi:uncharacterized membrane protein YjgN (DUF898 family)